MTTEETSLVLPKCAVRVAPPSPQCRFGRPPTESALARPHAGLTTPPQRSRNPIYRARNPAVAPPGITSCWRTGSSDKALFGPGQQGHV